MPVERKDFSKQVMAAYGDPGGAAYKAVAATANHLRTAIVKAFGSSYYKGGAFRSTLFIKQRIYYVNPYRSGNGWESTVGTPVIEALYWELGHRNLFTRNRERVRLWVPTAVREVNAMRETFGRVLARYMRRAV